MAASSASRAPATASASSELGQRLRETLARSAAAHRFSDQDIEGLYAIGLSLMNAARFERARSMLVLCALYRPYEARFLVALGVCHRRLKNEEQALQAFATAACVDPGHFEAMLQAAESLLRLGRAGEARRFLQQLVDCGAHLSAARPFAARAQVMMDLACGHPAAPESAPGAPGP